MINQEKEVNIKYEDFTNKNEFVTEFVPTILTESTPEIPQQCGCIGVDNWSSLSKTQKKRQKAKFKIKTEQTKNLNIIPDEEKVIERFVAVYDDDYIDKCKNLVKIKFK